MHFWPLCAIYLLTRSLLESRDIIPLRWIPQSIAHDTFLQCNYNILLALNLNWREGGHFPPPCPFWIRFCQLNFYQKFLNFFGGQTLGGAKDDHFSCFHSSGLTGVFRFLCSVITTIENQENLNFIIWGCIPRRKTSCVTNAIFEPLLQLKLTDMFDR